MCSLTFGGVRGVRHVQCGVPRNVCVVTRGEKSHFAAGVGLDGWMSGWVGGLEAPDLPSPNSALMATPPAGGPRSLCLQASGWVLYSPCVCADTPQN